MPIGNHISHTPGESIGDLVGRNLARAKSEGVSMGCLQIFGMGPTSVVEVYNAEQRKELSILAKEHSLRMFMHGSYFDNPWGVKPGFAKHLIKKELGFCDEMGADLVIHLAKKPPEEIAKVIPQLTKYSERAKLFLEIESYKSDPEKTYETPEKLARLFGLLAKEEDKQPDFKLSRDVALCVDTAHLFASGQDISTYEAMRDWLEETRGIKEISEIMIHFNDQTHPLGSGRDAHAPLTFGTIWGNYNPDFGKEPLEVSGASAVVDFLEKEDAHAIFERNPHKPKPGGKPAGDNIRSDYGIVSKLIQMKN